MENKSVPDCLTELWIEYMGPVLRHPSSAAWIKKAFQIWYHAAVERGFLDPNDETMKSFVLGKFPATE